jgi:hypothetical protein
MNTLPFTLFPIPIQPLLGILWCLSINSVFSSTDHWNISLLTYFPPFFKVVYLAMKTGVIVHLGSTQPVHCLFQRVLCNPHILLGYYATHAISSGYYATLPFFIRVLCNLRFSFGYYATYMILWVYTTHTIFFYLFGYYATLAIIIWVLCNLRVYY